MVLVFVLGAFALGWLGSRETSEKDHNKKGG